MQAKSKSEATLLPKGIGPLEIVIKKLKKKAANKIIKQNFPQDNPKKKD